MLHILGISTWLSCKKQHYPLLTPADSVVFLSVMYFENLFQNSCNHAGRLYNDYFQLWLSSFSLLAKIYR